MELTGKLQKCVYEVATLERPVTGGGRGQSDGVDEKTKLGGLIRTWESALMDNSSESDDLVQSFAVLAAVTGLATESVENKVAVKALLSRARAEVWLESKYDDVMKRLPGLEELSQTPFIVKVR